MPCSMIENASRATPLLDAVGDQPRHVLEHLDGHLADRDMKRGHLLVEFLRHVAEERELDDRHQMRGVVPVAHHRAGAPCGRKLVDHRRQRQARRVAGEDGIRPAEPVELGEQRLLELDFLRRGLDDEVARRDRVAQVAAERDTRERRVDGVRSDVVLLDEQLELVAHRRLGAVQHLLVGVEEPDGAAMHREGYRDAMPHCAGADDADGPDHACALTASDRGCRGHRRASPARCWIP